jgi:creatinine amidohydrolase
MLRENPLIIVPVGALEAHGPHLPLAADQIQAEATAEGLARRIPALIAPTITYGSCPDARGFPGTVSLSLGSLSRYAGEILREFCRMGARRLLVLSGHAEQGHMAALREAADETMRSFEGVRIVVLSDYDFVYELREKEAPASDGHGGLLETSRVLSMAAGMVGPERPVVEYRASRFVPGSPHPGAWPESVIGDTRKASAEIGHRVQAHVLDRLESTVLELLPP